MSDKIFKSYYIIFIFSTIFIGVMLSLAVKSSLFKSSILPVSHQLFVTVLINNTGNFVVYILFFAISPILQFFDLLTTTFQISMGIQLNGVDYTLSKLTPHGVIELPNFLFYQGLSQYLLYYSIKEKSFKKGLKKQLSFWKYYLGSYFLLICAAFLEGYIG